MSKDASPKVIVIVGPTASGKSGAGIYLAKKYKGEIISADSRQVYKGMDIGTGKVPRDSRPSKPSEFYSAGIRHHLLDVVSPKKEFTVEDFKHKAAKAIRSILKRKKTPIIVGGTGFYIDALIYDMDFPKVAPNKALRKELETKTAEELFKQLKKKDPVRAQSIDPHNKRRLIRALEILTATGKPVPHVKKSSPYDVLWVGMRRPWPELKKRIEKTLTLGLKHGMIDEVRQLLKDGVSHEHLHRFGLEYRSISQYLYLDGKQTLDEMKAGLLRAIQQYAKRQMTWFKRNKEIAWVSTPGQAEKLVKKFLKD
jgi:tRNA dimethylallyltransferase